MHAYRWIVLALAICSQWGIHATANEGDSMDLAGQEEFLEDKRGFKWALAQLQPGTLYPLSHITYPLVLTAITEAKHEWGGRLLPKYQAIEDKYREVGEICNDFGTPCQQWAIQFLATNTKFPELISYLGLCAQSQARRCPRQYYDILEVFGQTWIQHFKDVGTQAKSTLSNMLGMGKQA